MVRVCDLPGNKEKVMDNRYGTQSRARVDADMAWVGRSLAVLLVAMLAVAGCDTIGPRASSGAVAGGVLGGAAGGIMGYQHHYGGQGALIGAGLGALAGGLIGNTMDQQDRQQLAVNPGYLPLTQIAAMANQGTPDAIIINEIQRTHSVYHLSSEIITYLKQNRVSDQVIDYMMATGR